MRKRILILLFCIVMCLSLLPTAVFADETLTELHITGSITSVVAGELPAIDAVVASGEHASVEPYGINTHWSKNISGVWHAVGSDKIAVNDGSTRYAMRLCVNTDSGYSITDETKIFYNGSEIPGAIYNFYSWGAYVVIDLGKAVTIYYPVWVSGVQVSTANATDVLNDGGKVSFEVKDGTPTLNIAAGANINTVGSGGLIYSSMSGGLTINAPSGLTLSTTGSGNGILMSDNGPLTINGDVNISTKDECIDVPGNVIINSDVTVKSSSYEGISAGRDIIVNGSVNVQAGAYGLFSSNGNISVSRDVTIKSSYNSIYAPNGAVNIASGATWKMDSSGSTIYAKDIIIPSGSAIIEPADGEISESGSSKHTPDEHVIIGPAVVKYPVWVSGIRVTEANKGDVLGDGKVSYNPDTNTLKVLDGTNITYYNNESKYSLIYSSDTAAPLTIDAPNGLTLYSTNAGRGVSSGSDLIINGNVDITVGGYEGYAVVAGGSVTIDGSAKLTITKDNGHAIHATKDVTINGDASITVGGVNGLAIYAGKDVTINGAAKFNSTSNGDAISAGEYIIIDDDVEISGYYRNGFRAKGIKVNGDLTATTSGTALNGVSGDVEVEGNLKIEIANNPPEATINAIDSFGSVLIKGNAEISSTSKGSAISATNVQVDGDLTISGNFEYGIYAATGDVTMASGKTWDIYATNSAIVGHSIELNGNEITFPVGGMISTIDGYKVITESDGTTVATHVIIEPAVVMYTVTFNMNGHGDAVADKTVEEGTVVTEPTAPTAEGWTFGGWYTDAACTTAFDFTTPITAATTIYAKWTEILPVPVKHTISYDLNGGTMDGSTGIVTVDIEEGTVITLPAPTREGYVFDYWEGSKYYAGDSYTVTEDHTFTAQWKEVEPSNPTKPTEYTVTFNMNGHGTQVPAQTVEEGNKAAKPADPSASGYTFDGWYADATFSAAFDFDTAINADTTIYAKWTKETSDPGTTDPQPATYTVTFNMNGHGTQVSAQTVEEGNKAAKPADPSASGYTFDGWYADATFSAKFDFSSAINANTTVYAKWTEVKKDEPTKPADPTIPTLPKTGDNSHLFLWVALLFISGGALAGTAVYGKKKKYNAK